VISSSDNVAPAQSKNFLQNSVGMGQIAVASNAGTLRTLVGSCVSVALCDPKLHLAGLAHVLLPESHGTTEEPGRFADTAITELLRQLNKLSRDKQPHWKAKIAGGAAMFPGHEEVTVGTQNIAAVETLLRKNRIPIVAKVCGGEQGRRVSIDVATGSMDVAYTSDPKHHS
tara:strand:- start:2934 stop:3446 length:513 start_codon:yes stop_codon:yes gene_type:complete